MPTSISSQEHLFDLYFKFVAETEPPVIYHRWSLLTSISAFLGRRYWFPFGGGRIFPNQYVMLIGNPGTRKSTSIKTARKLISGAGYSTFSADKTTKEKFLLDLEGKHDDFDNSKVYATRGTKATSARDVLANLNLESDSEVHDGIPREVFIVADEFNEFAGTGNLDFLSMLGNLWDWDDEDSTYKYRLKTSKSVSIFQPTISILGGNTHDSFRKAFPEEALGQGILSRMLLIHSEPSGRKITFPPRPDDKLLINIRERLAKIKSTVAGEATCTATARNALNIIYLTWKELDDYRLKYYSSRRFTHLLKLCLVVSAMRCSAEIDLEDVVLGNTILTYAENSMSKALGEFGKSKNAEATHAVMTSLYETDQPLTVDDLHKVVSRFIDRKEQLQDILLNLASTKKIQFIEKRGFLPVQKPIDSKAMYVDMKLLKEYAG